MRTLLAKVTGPGITGKIPHRPDEPWLDDILPTQFFIAGSSFQSCVVSAYCLGDARLLLGGELFIAGVPSIPLSTSLRIA